MAYVYKKSTMTKKSVLLLLAVLLLVECVFSKYANPSHANTRTQMKKLLHQRVQQKFPSHADRVADAHGLPRGGHRKYMTKQEIQKKRKHLTAHQAKRKREETLGMKTHPVNAPKTKLESHPQRTGARR